MTQFEVRRTLECIELSAEAPFKKAKALLRIRRTLHRQVGLVSSPYEQALREGDFRNAAALRRLRDQNEEMSESIRDAAAALLRSAS